MTTVLRVNLPNINTDRDGDIIIKVPISVYVPGSIKTDSGEGKVNTPNGDLVFSCRGELKEDTLYYIIKIKPLKEED